MSKKVYYYRFAGIGESYHLLPARDMSQAEMQSYLDRVSRPEKDAILRLYEKVEGELPKIEQKVVDNRLVVEPATAEPEQTGDSVEPAPAEAEQPAS